MFAHAVLPQARSRASWPLFGLHGACALLLGTSLAQLLPSLPPTAVSAILLWATCAAGWKWPRLRLLSIVAAAAAWAMLRGAWALELRLPIELEARDLQVVGTVVGLPREFPGSVRFELRPDPSAIAEDAPRPSGDVRLSWYRPTFVPRPGQRVNAIVRLKRPRGVANPGGFDFERYALQARLAAVGYVRDAHAITPDGSGLDDLRRSFSADLAQRLGAGSIANLLRALSVGDQSAFSERDWDVLRATGTAHLVAISGFHIGVVAGLGALLARLFVFVWPGLALRIPRQQLAAVFALFSAAGYSAVAGFSLPVERTLLMIAVVAVCRLIRRHTAMASGLAVAIWVLLVVDPLAVLSVGFWLSFAGVAWLLFCLSGRVRRDGLLLGFGRAQWAATLGLLPFSVWFFQQSSIVGPLANAVAIPWISLALVPLLLLAFGAWLWLPMLYVPLLTVASYAAAAIWWLLQALAAPSWSVRCLAEPALPAMLLAVAGMALLLLPRGIGVRGLGAFLLLPTLLPRSTAPPPGAFDLVQFDVGQGLAVLVRTSDHVLLYDTGAGIAGGWDMGEAAVVPSMRSMGITRLDTLVISHGDNDHAGGASSVIAAYAPAQLWRSDERDGAPSCRAGTRWEWDGVRFEFLHPPPLFPYLRNSSCCVLRVSTGDNVALLPGDIPADIEMRLLREHPGALPARVLLAPHHGSRSSSSTAFLDVVHPQVALISAGNPSRFGHPHAEALARYERIGARILSSPERGMISLRLTPDGGVVVGAGFRRERPRYWREAQGVTSGTD